MSILQPQTFSIVTMNSYVAKYVVCLQVADIFAVGLQEQCWRCNKERMMEIGQAFMRRLNVRYAGQLFFPFTFPLPIYAFLSPHFL